MSGRRAFRHAFLGLPLACLAAVAISADETGGPRPGDVLAADDGTMLRGWRYSGGALWGEKSEHCCVAYFSRGKAVMLALTERTGPEKDARERIRVVHRLPRLEKSQETADCVMDGHVLLFALRDMKTGRVMGYRTDGKRFIEIVRPFAEVERLCDFYETDE